MEDWRDISYLNRGSAVQKEVYGLLMELGILRLLADYSPLLVGTIPLGIQVESSDLDIICEVHDHEQFTSFASQHFGEMDDFISVTRVVQDVPRTKINFCVGGWPIELFGQPVKTELQNGYLHMLIESELLGLLGENFRELIIRLKKCGMKTEPAFAQVLGLEGDPYEALLELGRLTPEELISLCKSIKAKRKYFSLEQGYE